MAQLFPWDSPWQSPRQGGFRECNFDKLQAVEPVRQVRSEAGLIEYFDEQNEQFRCTGVFVIRDYAYQRVQRFTQGDVIALPSGVAHWFYNDGDVPIVAVYVFDINSNANQLEPKQKEFLLAGNYNGVLQSGQNILNGFNVQLLSQAFGIREQTTRRIQSLNRERGEIIRVELGLQFLKPVDTQQQRQQQQSFQPIQHPKGQSGPYRIGQTSGGSHNGLEENFCSLEPRLNIEDPSRVDTYNPHSGSITHLNGQNFPILNLVQMSATRVNLYQNAILSPFWNINAHSVVYMIQGHALVQVVNNQGRTVFNGPLRRGQLLIIPQNYVVLKKAEREGFQYIAFKTNANSMVSSIAGKNSILHALPVDVITNAYHISIQEAQNLKNNRGEEIGAFRPKFAQSIIQSHV
ncbi:hypothetical protein BRADI_2g37860v3 [Brachypodium distachyon]|uniref:Cupin type-1 domain-containing protein n=1 Tax=Brachypodium distachyon TaxID=15368 RepID=A0A0Q3G8Z8_BRADI|nr:hypothetical protein BRADI_2g37860v3 [Brachypodium distachyon]